MSKWTWGWVAIGLAFLVWEIAGAIVGGPGPQTLSEHVWTWFAWRGGWIVLLGGLSYLTWHLVRGAYKKGHK